MFLKPVQIKPDPNVHTVSLPRPPRFPQSTERAVNHRLHVIPNMLLFTPGKTTLTWKSMVFPWRMIYASVLVSLSILYNELQGINWISSTPVWLMNVHLVHLLQVDRAENLSTLIQFMRGFELKNSAGDIIYGQHRQWSRLGVYLWWSGSGNIASTTKKKDDVSSWCSPVKLPRGTKSTVVRRTLKYSTDDWWDPHQIDGEKSRKNNINVYHRSYISYIIHHMSYVIFFHMS